MYDTLLFLHVLAAFAVVAAVVVYTAVLVARPRVETRATGAMLGTATRVGDVLWLAGGVGTIVLGIWLAIYLDGYELWDGWILASLVVWAIASETGRRASAIPAEAAGLERRRAILWHVLRSVAILVLLVLMIEKPGGV